MLIIIFGIITCVYAGVIFAATYGWKHPLKSANSCSLPFISVIIAVRNEAQTIAQTIQYLKLQDYPSHLFEVIIINDHSEDETGVILEAECAKLPNFYTYLAPDNSISKKQAIAFAQTHAKGDYLLFTDGDCTMNQKWISTFAAHIPQNKLCFLFGAVDHIHEKKVIERFFTLDFLSLIATQGGLANINHPYSCNAANMLISKELATLSRNETYASGHDIFLLHAAKKNTNTHIQFIQDKNALVYTLPPNSIKSFIQQRIRWSSKSAAYKDFDSIFIANCVYLENASIFVAFIISILYIQILPLAITLLIAKIIIDGIFFYTTLPFFNKKRFIVLSIPFQFFYFIYITLIPIFALTKPLYWKGRRIS